MAEIIVRSVTICVGVLLLIMFGADALVAMITFGYDNIDTEAPWHKPLFRRNESEAKA